MLRATAMMLIAVAMGDLCVQPSLGGGYGGFQQQQPTQFLAQASDTDSIEFILQVTNCVLKQQSYEYTVMETFITPEGKTAQRPTTRTATRNVCEYVSTSRTAPAGPQTRYFELDGRPVDAQAAAERLRKPTLVLISADDQKVPDYYAYLFKAGTLVATNPLADSPPPMYSMPPANVPQPNQAPTAGPVVSHRAAAHANVYETVGLAPKFRFARVDGKGAIRLREYSERVTSELSTKPADASNGQPAKLTTVRSRRIQQVHDTLEFDLKDVEAFLANGTPVSEVGLASMLARETTVLTSADGKRINPFWLANIKPTTLIILHPVSPAAVMQPMPYAAAPPVIAPTPMAPAPVLNAPAKEAPAPQPRPTEPPAT
jgi:hypothetical protein